MPTGRLVLRALALVAAPAVCAAQPRAVPAAPSGRAIVACRGQRIDDIVIYATAPTVANLERVPRLAAIARAAHMTTRPQLIERYLLLDRGESCDELRRAESERILRAQPFIADAEVFVVANEDGGVDLEVATSDEGSIVLGGNVRAQSPLVTSLLLGNANVAGQGIYAAAGWRDGDGFRPGYRARITDYQFLGRPLTFGASGERAVLGGAWRVEGGKPYYTDLQRTAWRMRVGSQLEYVELRRPDGERPRVTLDRSFFELGGITRVRLPGYLALVGLSLTSERTSVGSRLVRADTGIITDLGPVPVTYAPARVGRINALLGLRGLRFVRVDGLDALAGAQDLATGFQLGTQVGHSNTQLGAAESDFAIAGDLYLGTKRGASVMRLQLQGEGRHALGQAVWDDVLATGRASHVRQLSARHLHSTVAEFSGGYRQRVPFQLRLGIPQGGVRGFEQSTFAGGRRLVARAEERYVFPAVRRQADVGIAAFADAGKQWAGDVPYGVTTAVKGSVGVSLLVAVPARSARMWRADVALPQGGGAGSAWTVRVSNVDRTAFEYRPANDVVERRAVTVPASLFSWP